MNVVLYSSEAWPLSEKDLGMAGINLKRVVGTATALGHWGADVSPQVIFIHGFSEASQLLSLLTGFCASNPHVAVVPVCPNPTSDLLLKLMQMGVREVLPSAEPAGMRGALQRVQMRLDGTAPAGPVERGQVLGVLSAKGGDGGSVVAANLAAALAQSSRKKVLLVDLALPFGDADMYVTREAVQHDLADACDEIDRLDVALLESMSAHVMASLHLLAAPREFAKLMRIGPSQVVRLLDVAAQGYAWIVVDMGTGFDPVRLQALERMDQLILVTTPGVLSLRHAVQSLRLLAGLGVEAGKLAVVTRGVAKPAVLPNEFEKVLGKAIARQIPFDASGVEASLVQGVPLVALRRNAVFSRAMLAWADAILGKTAGRPSLWRLFGNK